MNKTKKRICPICKVKYSGFPALSRRDNKTEICPDCGTAEAFDDFFKHIQANKAAIKKENWWG